MCTDGVCQEPTPVNEGQHEANRRIAIEAADLMSACGKVVCAVVGCDVQELFSQHPGGQLDLYLHPILNDQGEAATRILARSVLLCADSFSRWENVERS